MVIIIDGYNLLRNIFSKSKGLLDQQRKQLIRQLAYYKTKKSDSINEIIIVFDAGPLLHATREIKDGVVIIFSGQKKSADEWIIDYAEKHHNKEMLLVTQDRKLIQSCEKFHTQSIDIFEFYNLVKAVLWNNVNQESSFEPNQIEKYQNSDLEIDEMLATEEKTLALLMEQASIKIPQKEESEKKYPDGQHRKGNPLKFSKKEKTVYAKLKKLR